MINTDLIVGGGSPGLSPGTSLTSFLCLCNTVTEDPEVKGAHPLCSAKLIPPDGFLDMRVNTGIEYRSWGPQEIASLVSFNIIIKEPFHPSNYFPFYTPLRGSRFWVLGSDKRVCVATASQEWFHPWNYAPQNVLVRKGPGNRDVIKLCGFGKSQRIPKGQKENTRTDV
ncbi:hypothetical protein Tco_0546609 [Tanacetum coccineum]